MQVEINVANCTAFKTNDIEIAKLFLVALNTMSVKMQCELGTVKTDADIALAMLERADASS